MKKKYISKNDWNLIIRSLQYSKKYKKYILFLFITMIIMLIFEFLNPFYLGQIIQNISEKNYKGIYTVALIFSSLYVGQSVFILIKTYLETNISNNIIYDLKKDIYCKILNLSMSNFDKLTVGELISRLQGDVNVIADIITNQLLNLILSLIRIIVLTLLLFKINYKLTVIVILQFPIKYFLLKYFGKILRGKNNRLKKYNDLYFTQIQQVFSNIKHVKTFGIKKIIFKKFDNISSTLKNFNINIVMTEVRAQVICNIINCLDEFIIILLSITLIIKGIFNIQMFIVFITYSGELVQSLNIISNMNSSFQQMLSSLDRIYDLLDEENFTSEVFGEFELKDKLNGNIKFENIFFSYDKKYVLKDINLNLRKRETYYIIGKNGCGKSTILNLLCGLYKPNKGKILLDEFDITIFSEKMLRKNISIVHQENIVFNLTFKQNFELICPEITLYEIKNICSLVGLNKYIESLDDKYNTIITERGQNLSGGQKQRLALAMCLTRDTPIILLDEVTSAIDNESNKIISDIIKYKLHDKTVLIVTHNLSTLHDNENIIFINNGNIIAVNKHGSLLKSNKLYREICNKQ